MEDMEENKTEEAWTPPPTQPPRPTHGFTNVSPIATATSLAENSRIKEQQAAAAAQEASEKKGWFGRRK